MASYTRSKRNRIFLGLIKQRGWLPWKKKWKLLGYSEDAHLITLATPGAGKFRDLLAVSIMLYENSLIVIDPKGQAAAVTARGRKELGQDVVILNPFNIHAARLGPSACYNAMDTLNPESLSFGVDCDALADAIVLHADNDSGRYFTDSARSLVSGVIRYVAKYETDPANKNLGYVRSIIAGQSLILQTFCRKALRSNDNLISDKLARFAKDFDDSKEIQGIVGTAITQTDFLGNEAINASISKSTFRFSDLRRKRTTVYIILPARYLNATGKWFRLLVAGALAELLHEEGSDGIPVLAILDEFAQLGHMSSIENAIGIARGYRFQIWPILQSAVQLSKTYGKGWEAFISAAGVRQFFAPRDDMTASHVAKTAGNETIIVNSQSEAIVSGQAWGAGFDGVNVGTNVLGRPLLFPDEVTRLPDDEQIVFIHNLPPIRAWRKPYFSKTISKLRLKGRPLSSYFDPDPQHPKTDSATATKPSGQAGPAK